MRIYHDAYQLMSETGRNLWEMGQEVRPNSMQNKIVKGDEAYLTKELICEQYCLTSLENEDALFAFDKRNKEWVKHELLERLNFRNFPINPGDAYKKRQDVWDEFLVKGRFDYTYNERIWHKPYGDEGHSVMNKILNELTFNPDTRQAVLMIYHPSDTQYIGGVKRVPCSIYYDFLIRTNANGEKQLNICYHQRSSDFVTHFGNDVWLAWYLMVYVADKIGIKHGYLFHTIDSLHSYKKDWDKLKTPISTYLAEVK